MAKIKVRTDLRCPTEHFHTVMKLTSHGWVCANCGTVISKEEIARQEKQLKARKR